MDLFYSSSGGLGTTAVLNELLGASLVVAGVLHPRVSLLRSRLLQALGDASYSLYLTHLFTLGVMRVVWVRLLPGEPTWVSAWTFMFAALFMCALAAHFTYLWMEKPLLRWLSPKRSSERVPQPA